MGNIGFTIAKRAFACGMKILYSGRTKKLLQFRLFLIKTFCKYRVATHSGFSGKIRIF